MKFRFGCILCSFVVSTSISACSNSTGFVGEAVAVGPSRPTRSPPSESGALTVFRPSHRTLNPSEERPRESPAAPLGAGFLACEIDHRIESVRTAVRHPGWILIHARVDQMPVDATELLDPSAPLGNRIRGREFRVAILATADSDLRRLPRYQRVLLPLSRISPTGLYDSQRDIVTSVWSASRTAEASGLTQGQEFLAVVRQRTTEQSVHILDFVPVQDGVLQGGLLAYPIGSAIQTVVSEWNRERASYTARGEV